MPIYTHPILTSLQAIPQPYRPFYTLNISPLLKITNPIWFLSKDTLAFLTRQLSGDCLNHSYTLKGWLFLKIKGSFWFLLLPCQHNCHVIFFNTPQVSSCLAEGPFKESFLFIVVKWLYKETSPLMSPFSKACNNEIAFFICDLFLGTWKRRWYLSSHVFVFIHTLQVICCDSLFLFTTPTLWPTTGTPSVLRLEPKRLDPLLSSHSDNLFLFSFFPFLLLFYYAQVAFRLKRNVLLQSTPLGPTLGIVWLMQPFLHFS